MKKALWFQLRALLPADSLTPLADAEQLARYRYQRAVPRRTLARAEQERIYKARVVQWLQLPENRWCRVYRVLSGRRVPATHCHHFQGRRGMLLLYEPFWIPVSWEGHRWIEEHRQRARELGLLCPLGKYNSQVCDPQSLPRRQAPEVPGRAGSAGDSPTQ